MRVLHVISNLDPIIGGPATAVAGMVRAQLSAGIEASIIATWKNPFDSTLADGLKQGGVMIDMVGPTHGPLYRHPQLQSRLEKQIAEVDVVHIHMMWEEIQHLAARLARGREVPYVMTPHGMLTHWSLSKKRWKKRLYLAWRMNAHLTKAAAIHYMTDAERDNLAIANLPAASLTIPLGVNLSEFEQLPPRGQFRRRHPQMGDRPVIAFMGRIHPGKGLEYLVPALARLSSTEAILLVIGPDSRGFRRTIEAMIAEHNLQDRVIFTGMLRGTDRVAALVDADLFALPSDHENFGVVVIEALAAGLPVVVSEHVPMHRLICEAGVGSTVSQTPPALAAELDRWLSDDRLRTSATERAIPFVHQHYDWTSIARRWVLAYRHLVSPTQQDEDASGDL